MRVLTKILFVCATIWWTDTTLDDKSTMMNGRPPDLDARDFYALPRRVSRIAWPGKLAMRSDALEPGGVEEPSATPAVGLVYQPKPK